jgi:hypothetical protein
MTCARISARAHVQNTDIPSRTLALVWLACRAEAAAKAGGADRDRTDDLKLAKLALSQLSYGPGDRRWAAQVGLPGVARGDSPGFALRASPAAFTRFASEAWWARDELNVRPHAYQACALTT